MPPHDDPRADFELVAALNAGDVNAFAPLYHRHRDWVVRLAWRFTRNEQDALDVMQETFAYLARKFPDFELRVALRSFLFPVVRNLSIAARNKTMRFAGNDLSGPLSLRERDGVRASADRDELSLAMSYLSELHRDILLMRFVDDLTLAEIAHALNVPLGTVKSRLHHAIAALREDERAKKFFSP